MEKLTFDYTNALNFFGETELEYIAGQVQLAARQLHDGTGPGNAFLGWLALPEHHDRIEFAAIREAAAQIHAQSDALVIIGIGGSYLGARAAIECLGHPFHNQLDAAQRSAPEIYYAGHHLSPEYLTKLVELLSHKEFSINIISKSGTTTEPAIAFRILRKILEERYGKDGARERIYATTDARKGALNTLARQEGYQMFVVPDDVGGRFSVLSAVGLLPIAAAGIDIDGLMHGAKQAMDDFASYSDENICYQYAAIRNLLYRKGKTIEMLINYDPRLHYVAEWWKQLYGESEGKERKGIFPASANFTTDLHSLGQYIQDGRRHLFETLVAVASPGADLILEEDEGNLDGLNYLAGKTLDEVNKKAAEGTLMAHVDGGVPNLVLTMPEATAWHLGYLFYFFEKACAISGYLLAVNPFDQPGVEAYKRNMFQLLGKPGY